jgi:hypothetical protein
MSRLTAAILSTLVLAAFLPAHADTALVRASLVHNKLVECGVQGTLLDGCWIRTFRIKNVLIGAFSGTRTVRDSKSFFSAEPRLGGVYYLLLSDPSEKREIIWADWTGHGLCMDPKVAQQYSIETDVKILQQEEPCRQP